MPSLIVYELERLDEDNQDILGEGIARAKLVGGLGGALVRVMRTINGLIEHTKCGQVYVGRAGATPRHVFNRFIAHRYSKNHVFGTVTLLASTSEIAEWEAAITAIISRFGQRGLLTTVNLADGGGRLPSWEESCIYVTCGPGKRSSRPVNDRDLLEILDELSGQHHLGNRMLERVREVMHSDGRVTLEDFIDDGESDAKEKDAGTCIRCSSDIDYDTQRPYCLSCYKSWSRYKNQDYEESYCHACGREKQTSMRKPECRACHELSHRW